VTIAWRHASKAASHSRPGSRSPAFASSMIFWATVSRVGLTILSACWRATRAISKAKPRDEPSPDRTHGLADAASSTWDYVNSTVRNLLEDYSDMHGIATNRGDRGVLSTLRSLA
jgi:hypothetical protein